MTKPSTKEKRIHKGELHKEVASMLCFLSEPDSNDIVLDPFCGYGSIPIERALTSPFRKIFAEDKNPKMILISTEKKSLITGSRNKKVKVRHNDILDGGLKYPDHSIDKIITDPPWGFYEKHELTTDVFYKRMMEEFMRVIKPDGIVVVLTANKNEFQACLELIRHHLAQIRKFDILVSGKKAAVYKLKIKNGDRNRNF
jgi:tRNA G10  N-methylase Trm11